jgi:hypothetical protein
MIHGIFIDYEANDSSFSIKPRNINAFVFDFFIIFLSFAFPITLLLVRANAKKDTAESYLNINCFKTNNTFLLSLLHSYIICMWIFITKNKINIETGIVISIFSRENTLIFSIVSTPKYAIIVKNITHNIIVPYPLFFIFF